MLSEQNIVEMIITLELNNDNEMEMYLDESEQSALSTLYDVLDRNLTLKENNMLKNRREKYYKELGIIDD